VLAWRSKHSGCQFGVGTYWPSYSTLLLIYPDIVNCGGSKEAFFGSENPNEVG
jgi:hypothetical protein